MFLAQFKQRGSNNVRLFSNINFDPSKDYYRVLGVDKDISKQSMKVKYYQLAQKYHPDKQTGDEKKFKEISQAYEVLSNDNQR